MRFQISEEDEIPQSYYDRCARLGCDHYRCEHNLCLGKAIYVAPGHEKQFEGVSFKGCWNEGCECEEFVESNMVITE